MTVREQVDRDLDALVTAHPMGEALSEVARNLASRLDDPDEKAPAAVAKELRATLLALAERAVDDDDDLDAQLSAPVRDAAQP
jgi:hypothetical protein